MRQFLIGMVVVAVALAITMGGASAKRVALVIGNADYDSPYLIDLDNPVRDAQAMAALLETRLGFEVISGYDADQDDMASLLEEFRRKARGAEIGLVYFSGHGLQYQGESYVMPSDSAPRYLSSIAKRSFSVAEVLEKLEGVKTLKLAIFDSCRDNTLVQQLAALEPDKARSTGLSKGMARPDVSLPDLLVAYATQPGATAADGFGDNSPYTKALLRNLAVPNRPIGSVFNTTTADVRSATENKQSPVYQASLTRDYVLLEEAASPPPPPGQCSAFREQALFEAAQSGNAAAREAFRQTCPNSPLLAALDTAGANGETIGGPIGQAGETFRDCLDCPEMVAIPGGSFVMGSPESEEGRDENEGPQRTVQIQAFALGQYEVTFAEWDACAGAGVCREIKSGGDWSDGDQGWGRGRLPVITVSWEDVQGYVGWLNSRFPGAGYRLPSEAEWEYAARAGTTTAYWTGSSISEEQANFGRTVGKTLTVGSFPPNDFGLYDVHGNVWEWVQDCWNGSYSGAPTNGTPREFRGCSRSVLRGGSWYVQPQSLRSAVRFRSHRDARDLNVGFRVARTLGFPD